MDSTNTESNFDSSQLSSCAIGLDDNSEKCHKTAYSKKIGFKLFKDLTTEDQELLCKRSSLTFDEESQICLHHHATILTYYQQLQRHCCNPFMKKDHTTTKSLKPINCSTVDRLNQMTKKTIKPGQKWCFTCQMVFKKKVEEISPSSEENQEDEDIEMQSSEALNTSLTSLGVSPVKFQKISKRDAPGYAKRKIHQAQSAIETQIVIVGGLEAADITKPSTSQQCENCNSYDQLLEELQQKLKVSSRLEKLQILTLAPKHWSIERTSKEFEVTPFMVKKARKLKADHGILAMPGKKQGKVLSEEVKAKVQLFFEDDEFSRMCPGKKDFVAIRIQGERIEKQKRLLLCNLKEIYNVYRERNGPEIGISKFCELRPKWCVTVGSSGTHSVCVCMIHQNVKLMVAGSTIKDDYKCLIQKTVCNLESKECMLHRCEDCPGEDGLKEFLAETFKDSDPEELIEFKQWIHTDRDTLDTKQLPAEDFIVELTSKIWNLSIHHYIAKHQSGHLKTIKENLKNGELVILMDFAENYSFIVQDAVQGFHWDNSQATLHPFVVYHKVEDELQSLSICIISDCLRHDTIAVHTYVTALIKYLKTIINKIMYIRYFSDGSAAQYKNFKNFMNLCHHKTDFHIDAEWNFFGTSHGKSPCDGIGGTTKRMAARASLQRPFENQILTPNDLFVYCDQTLPGIKFLFITKEEVEEARPALEERFQFGRTLAGTRENHQFVPIDQNQIRVSRVSNDTTSFTASINQNFEIQNNGIKVANLMPGQYIACIYDNLWWIGNICEISEEQHDAFISFMHPHGPAPSFHWPDRNDCCWIPEEHLIATIPAPSAASMGRQYTLSQVTMASITGKFNLE